MQETERFRGDKTVLSGVKEIVGVCDEWWLDKLLVLLLPAPEIKFAFINVSFKNQLIGYNVDAMVALRMY